MCISNQCVLLHHPLGNKAKVSIYFSASVFALDSLVEADKASDVWMYKPETGPVLLISQSFNLDSS